MRLLYDWARHQNGTFCHKLRLVVLKQSAQWRQSWRSELSRKSPTPPPALFNSFLQSACTVHCTSSILLAHCHRKVFFKHFTKSSVAAVCKVYSHWHTLQSNTVCKVEKVYLTLIQTCNCKVEKSTLAHFTKRVISVAAVCKVEK